MGLVKREMEEVESRGYGRSDNLVCHECTSDYALKKFIRDNGHRNQCYYCGKDRKCVYLEDLMEPIMSGILSEYEDANECMGWDSQEGGFVGTTYTASELVNDELYDELGIENQSLLDDIANIINDCIVWCDRDPYFGHEDENAYYSWSAFSKLVKEKIRYVFFKALDDNNNLIASSPAEILEIIGGYVNLLKLIVQLNPETTRIYRGRTHKEKKTLATVNDFSSPPSNRAKANRMSPEGISMFYGAFDKYTTLSEIYCTTDEYATIAEFQLVRSLRVLDLTKPNLMKMPSIFDKNMRNRRAPLLFLRRFAQDISQKNNSENNIDYVPTQIVTEYFRHIFRTTKMEVIDGIVYRSAQNKGGKCIVLFLDQEDCIQKGAEATITMNPSKLTQYRKAYQDVEKF